MAVVSPAVIGRGGELTSLDTALGATRKHQGNAVFLIGEAGIGKSRLAAECGYRAFESDMPILRGHAGTNGMTMPFRPLAEALLSLFRVDGPPRDPQLDPYRHALSDLVPEWRGGRTEGAAESLLVLAEAVLRVLAVVGRDRGCLLILEDLHDSDPETLAVLGYLIDNLADLPVLVLGTLRPHASPALDLAQASARQRLATVVDLLPLTDDSVRALAAACLEIPVEELPVRVAERLIRCGDGNPFVIEELISGMLDTHHLVAGLGGWRVVGDVDTEVPATVVHSVAHRVGQLAADGREMLRVAAVLGRRFPLPIVQRVTGLDDRQLMGHLRAGVDAQLIAPDSGNSDWYAFRHTLTAEALLAPLLPAERAAVAARCADAVQASHPELADQWCQLAATLRLAAGDAKAAGLLLAEAGRRALRAGAATSAVNLLERATHLLPACDDLDVLESLLYALAEAGQTDRAFHIAQTQELNFGLQRRAALHTRLAGAAITAGRWADGVAQAALARQLLESAGSTGPTAALDVIEANLIATGQGRGADRIAEAERLARQGVDVAERVPLPAVACQGWQLLAMLARRKDFDEAQRCLQRMLTIAEQYELPIWRIQALLRLGVNQSLRTGDLAGLEYAAAAARRTGAISLRYTAESSLAMTLVRHGRYQTATELADECAEATHRLRNVDDYLCTIITKAMIAAHQAKRRVMEQHLAEFRHAGGEQSLYVPLALGLCQAVCALLEEDRPGAEAKLAAAVAWEDENPTVFYLSGRHGLRPLLAALAGRLDMAEYEVIAGTPPAGLRWNEYFLMLARAVLLGRAGKQAEATTVVAQAQNVGEPYPLARFLGLRLVAEAAQRDRWGEATGWLRDAEFHFRSAGVPAVSAACRALIRQAGVRVTQRREGTNRVPPTLRRLGVTVREYDVFLLLAERRGNQDIARRLFISPRTVEKHVASLITKTGRRDRTAMCDFATQFAA